MGKKKETVRRFLSGGQLLGCEKEDRQIMKKPTSRALTYRTGINFSSLSFLLFLKKRKRIPEFGLSRDGTLDQWQIISHCYENMSRVPKEGLLQSYEPATGNLMPVHNLLIIH